MADELVAKCREAGLTHFLFVRHANAAPLESSAPVRTDQPHDWRISDQRRVLTPKGHGQCEAAGEAWFSALPVRALLVSPARRAARLPPLASTRRTPYFHAKSTATSLISSSFICGVRAQRAYEIFTCVTG